MQIIVSTNGLSREDGRCFAWQQHGFGFLQLQEPSQIHLKQH